MGRRKEQNGSNNTNQKLLNIICFADSTLDTHKLQKLS